VAVAVLSIGFTAPALADYYVVQDATTKKCTVVTEKPKESTSVKVLGTTIFKSESEAVTTSRRPRSARANKTI
jgi:hypothetical protein